ncbi:MAG: TRAM domain-containing protein [Acidobacteria bacterium]|nr:TRAM domain-containing protein [Acidobacteriota bacterium]
MVYLKLFFYLCVLVFSVFSKNFVFAVTLIAVLAISDCLFSRFMRENINGFLMSLLVFAVVAWVVILVSGVAGVNRYFILIGAGYLAVVSAMLMPSGPREAFPGLLNSPDNIKCKKILDASILMDGRILDLVETGFLDGTILVPRFVLKQIQRIYETGKELKQQRAAHALELIRKLQNMKSVLFKVCEIDFPQEMDVDQRIISLAKKLNAKIVTNDYTLNRVASLEEIEVLNINELANALKPVALPGETMSIHIIKKGKEDDQGIGYLDDGTMVVIDGGEQYIGDRVQTKITSILQNPAGKMIFGTVATDEESE